MDRRRSSRSELLQSSRTATRAAPRPLICSDSIPILPVLSVQAQLRTALIQPLRPYRVTERGTDRIRASASLCGRAEGFCGGILQPWCNTQDGSIAFVPHIRLTSHFAPPPSTDGAANRSFMSVIDKEKNVTTKLSSKNVQDPNERSRHASAPGHTAGPAGRYLAGPSLTSTTSRMSSRQPQPCCTPGPERRPATSSPACLLALTPAWAWTGNMGPCRSCARASFH